MKMGAGARLEPTAQEEEPYNEWVMVADDVIKECMGSPCRITVVGPVDAGKTSLVAMIANRDLRVGIEPLIVDCDIGQTNLGPPGFVGLTRVSNHVSWLRRLDPETLRFVGSIEPSVSGEKHVIACSELVEIASKRSNIVTIDTDGWIEGIRAIEHKITLLRVRAVKTTHVVVVGS